MGELGAAGIINLILPPYLLPGAVEDGGLIVVVGTDEVVTTVVGALEVVITGAVVV